MKTTCPITNIIKRNGSIVRYDRNRIFLAILKAMTASGCPNNKTAESLSRKVENALVNTYGEQSIPTVEDIQDVVEKVLMENKLTAVAKNYIIYRNERARIRAMKAHTFEVTDNVPYRKIYEVLRWNVDHQCDSVHAINRIISSKKFPDLVAAADQRLGQELKDAVAEIMERYNKIRIVIVAGPSSSGKTTTSLKIKELLKENGINLKTLNIDNYFFDLEKHPKDEFGDYDYETPQAIDLAMVNQHLIELLNGKIIKTPKYSFKQGKRILNAQEFSLKKNEVLLIDSLHGLYDEMTKSIPAENKFRLYIETLGQFRAEDGSFMRWADNRLLRRMIRDKQHRNLQPLQTIAHWHYVRNSELKFIIPFIKKADFIINTALPYELPVLKALLFRFISRARSVFSNDPRRLDAYIRANRVYSLLKPLKNVTNHCCIPPDSLLREFIGGSKYTY